MNKSLKVLLYSNGLFVFAASFLGPLYAIFVAGIDQAVMAVSLSWSIALISGVIFTYFVSRSGDKVKEKEYLLVAGYLIRAGVWVCFIFTHSLGALLILQFVIGIGEALGNPAFDTIFAQHLDKNKFVFDYSHWKIMEKIATAGGALLGGLIVSIYGFSPLFVIMSVLALLVSLAILLQPRRLL